MNSAPNFFTYNHTPGDTAWHRLPAVTNIAEGADVSFITRRNNANNILFSFDNGTTNSKTAPITLYPGSAMTLKIKDLTHVAVQNVDAADVLEYIVERTKV